MNSLTVFFGCQHCEAVYTATQRRIDTLDQGSLTCLSCGETVHFWNGRYTYSDFQAFNSHTGRVSPPLAWKEKSSAFPWKKTSEA